MPNNNEISFVARLKDQVSGHLRGMGGNIKKFSDEGSKSLNNFATKANLLKGALAAVGGAIVLRKIATDVATMGDSLDKTSSKLGIHVERLQELQFAAAQTAGVTDQTFNVALQRMTRRSAEAAGAVGPLRETFTKLGISVGELKTLSPDALFSRIADGIQGMGSQGERVKTVFQIFDTEGVNLVNTLQQGSEGIQKFKEEAQALGLTMSRDQIDSTVRYTDAMDKFGRALNALKVDLILPLMESLTTVIKNAVESGSLNSMADIFRKVGIGIATMVAVSSDAINGLKLLFRSAQVVSAQLELIVQKSANVLTFGSREEEVKAAQKNVDIYKEKFQDLADAMQDTNTEKYFSSMIDNASKAEKALEGTVLAPTASSGDDADQEKKAQQIKEAQRALAEARINATKEGVSRELELLAVKHNAELEAVKGNHEAVELLVKTHELEKQAIIENAQAAQRERRETFNQEYLQLEFDRISQEQQMRKQATEQAASMQRSLNNELLGSLQGLSSALAEESKAFFLLSKGIAAAQIVVNAAQGIGGALAMPFGTGLPLIPIIKGIAAAQLATVAATTVKGFRTGGMVDGPEQLIRVNERGRESVINARGTAALGVEGVNALNRGQMPGGISIGPTTIHIGGSPSRETVSGLRGVLAEHRSKQLKEWKRMQGQSARFRV